MAKKNFYALKNTGQIYTSWPECQEALRHVKNPVFKGFATKKEAQAFLLGNEEQLMPKESLFVDGSFDKEHQVVGGAFLHVKDDQIIFEQKLKDDQHLELLKLRNVGGELLATIYALKYAQAKGLTEVVICHDYQGIASWADGSWQAKTPLTKRYVAFIQKFKAETNAELKFYKISAHTGVKFNERADQLAKEACGLK